MSIHLKRAEQQLKAGKSLEKVKASLALYFKELDEYQWKQEQLKAYDELFPKTEDVIKTDSEGVETIVTYEIDYSEDTTFVSFDEYLKETKVVQEFKPAKKDIEGNVIVEAVPEITEKIRVFTAKDNYDVEINNYMLKNYARFRKPEYPPIEEFIDAYVKDDIEGIEDYKNKCLAIKKKYPKNV